MSTKREVKLLAWGFGHSHAYWRNWLRQNPGGPILAIPLEMFRRQRLTK